MPDHADLHWLDGVPATTTGAAWGVPWPRGHLRNGTAFALTTSSGRPVPVQTWPLARWPDGSLKWTGHAIGPDAGLTDRLRLGPGTPARPASPVTVRQGGHIVLGNGVVEVSVATSGSVLIPSISRNGRVTASAGRLVCCCRTGPTSPMRRPPHGGAGGPA